jgi:hypothetical protein
MSSLVAADEEFQYAALLSMCSFRMSGPRRSLRLCLASLLAAGPRSLRECLDMISPLPPSNPTAHALVVQAHARPSILGKQALVRQKPRCCMELRCGN